MYIHIDKETKQIKSITEKKTIVIKDTEVIGYDGSIPDKAYNYKFINNDFVLNIDKVLQEAIKDKIKNFTKEFNNKLLAGYKCSNKIKMNATYKDINNLKMALLNNSSKVIVRDYDNNNHTLDILNVKEMVNELGSNYQKHLNKLWELKDKSNKIKDLDELDSLVWED